MDDNERNHIKTFDCHGDQNTLGLQWKWWLTAFELFADGKGLILNEGNANNRQRRCALMLDLAGPDVQYIFLTLLDRGDVKDYRKAVDALNSYFAPKVNTTYARHCFRQLHCNSSTRGNNATVCNQTQTSIKKLWLWRRHR